MVKRVKRLEGEKQVPEASAAAKHGGSDPRMSVRKPIRRLTMSDIIGQL